MHSLALRSAALTLFAAGVSDAVVAERLGLPRTTVRDWRRGVVRPVTGDRVCARCWQPMQPVDFTPDRYAELLGLYLGDGVISRVGRTWSLRISLDTAYPNLVGRCRDLVAVSFPVNRATLVPTSKSSNVVVNVYHSHLPCLFPHVGPGKKHHRRIALEPWQQAIIAHTPWHLLRGLLSSDGCLFVNRTGRYAYPSYDFSNRSQDILDIFCATCDAVGVEHRRYAHRVRIYRRAAVDAVFSHVGAKT